MGTKCILIIEDDEVTRMQLEAVLAGQGYLVALARTGQDGLEYLQNNGPPDLIILDMFMPAMDGWQFLRYHQMRWETIPVLVTTALKIGTDAWASSLGACGWLQKPFEAEELVAEVKRCLALADKPS